MMLTDGERLVVASSLMWACGCHFQQADIGAKLGHVKLAAEKADFAKECHRLLPMFQAGGKVVLDDADGPIIRAALGWAAMEHEKAAKESKRAEAVKRRNFSGECARLADMFQAKR